MTKSEYECLLERVRSGGWAEFNGRSAIDEAGVEFIAKAEGYDPSGPEITPEVIDVQALCNEYDAMITALKAENAKLKTALKKLNDKLAKEAAKAETTPEANPEGSNLNPEGSESTTPEKPEGDGGQE